MSTKFAVFDFDGTLIRWQLYHAIVDNLAQNNLVNSESYEKVKLARHKWKIRESQDAFKDYERELVNCYNLSLPSLPQTQLDQAINEVYQEHKQQVYVYTRDLVKELKEKGYFLIAISGSHREAVELVAKHYGFDDWVGTKYEITDGKFTGNYQLPATEKDVVLNKLIEEHDLSLEDSYGVGDSEGDIPMLELVQNPIAFNPTEKLLAKAKEHGWKVVIERKNVVYELGKFDKNGENNYHLL